MTWQDPIVALIVGWAVVALVRHLRAIVRSDAPATTAQGSCHGCDDGCGTDDIAPPRRPAAAPLPPGSLSVH